ncbi:MAG: helix-turn-helix domain-containing protein [Microbacteriaceae bacterium]
MKEESKPVKYLTIKEVSEITRISRGALSQLRYMKQGPTYLKPTPRTVLYREADVLEWLEESEVETS